MAHRENRRNFIKKTAAATVGTIAAPRILAESPFRITILPDASHPSIREPSVQWALERLREALASRGIRSEVREGVPERWPDGPLILLAHRSTSITRTFLPTGSAGVPEAAESLALIGRKINDRTALLVSGPDARGLVYGLLELADRITYAEDALLAFDQIDSVVESPANPLRSITRLFVSDVEDKSWFYDKSFWHRYLSMVIAQRFNRFSLTLGLGYDLPHHVLDAYFIFAYPFLVSVPGYDVKVRWLPKEEQGKNLEMLQWISGQVVARGLDFQLGLWSHTYRWIESPNANYTINGLTPANHGPYCRDALRSVLEACPHISGITFRAHSESGIPDGSYDFWKTVFEGVVRSGRTVGIDLHSKGIDHELIGIAVQTGMPVFVSPKLTAEHMGLPAHQIAIRERERTRPSSTPNERSFTRYGYADYFREDRKYDVYFRIWPGKHKVLMWGDPVMAAGYGRHAGFCGSLGLELCEPLTFKGRQGSGHASGRSPYLDDSLRPPGGEHEKYLYTYRMWGRHLYDPEADPQSWRRYLRYEFGGAAPAVEKSLGHASRILPLVTSAHLPSASAMTYWPELYTNMPIVDDKIPHPYGDTPEPKIFATVSPLDPGLFSSIVEFVRDGLQGEQKGKYSPLDVARWLESFAQTGGTELAKAQANVDDVNRPSFRRLAVDVGVHAGLGWFFARKIRAAIAYELFQKTGEIKYLEAAIHFYRGARDAWAGIVQKTRGVYIHDLNFGYPPHRRGHWADRLLAIEEDLEAMEKVWKEKTGRNVREIQSASLPANLDWMNPRPALLGCSHQPPRSFRPGESLALQIRVTDGEQKLTGIVLHYRHVNHAEEYQRTDMYREGNLYRASIPAEYTGSPYSLIYFFELYGSRHTRLYPGLEENLSNQPYFLVRPQGQDRPSE